MIILLVLVYLEYVKKDEYIRYHCSYLSVFNHTLILLFVYVCILICFCLINPKIGYDGKEFIGHQMLIRDFENHSQCIPLEKDLRNECIC